MTRLASPAYRWLEPPPLPAAASEALARSLTLSPLISEILVRRGVHTPELARRFLRPRLGDQHPPELLPDIGPAVARIEAAIRAGEGVLVHGDYDADGMCSAALLTRGLTRLGAQVTGFVPHRTRDGYDLGRAGLDRAVELGARLIVTADCGVSAVGAVRAASEYGIDVVVTDHHRPGSSLPEAAAVVNPNRSDSLYPFNGLAGVGVAFKVLSSLFRRAGIREEMLNEHLDLVALGTVSDLAPLRDENRVLVRAGLQAMARSRKPGIQALLRQVRLDDRERLEEDHLGFMLGPRLNSVGRMAAASTGLQLLLTDDAGEAERLARYLDEQNALRRTTDRRVLAEAEQMLEEHFDAGDRAVVLGSEGWHPGVIGIVASRIVDRVHRPVVLVAFDDGFGRGSGRSIGGFHLHRALERCADLVERYGGHRMAAGFDIRRENFEAFSDRFTAIAADELEADDMIPELAVDLVAPLPNVVGELPRWLRHLGPFGVENPGLLIEVRNVELERPVTTGAGEAHLKTTVVDVGCRLSAVGFGMGDRFHELLEHRRWDVVFEVFEDRWRGRTQFVARLRDFRPHDPGGRGPL
jgi:single-stranded-DNA-specific exonuclease